MRLIALIDGPVVMRRIIEHRGCTRRGWAGFTHSGPERHPNGMILLAYHPVPDIA